MGKNPKWSRDELILALELYMRLPPANTSQNNPLIVELSSLLNSLPVHPEAVQGEKFRNANGVYMKLCNFLRLDPSYEGAGLKRGGKLDERIWKEFSQDIARLKSTASAIRAGAPLIPPPRDEEDCAIDYEEEFPEGRVLTQLHRRRERNPVAVRKKKRLVLEKEGALACQVCGFDFQLAYGELGHGFAECHHLRPLSELVGRKATRLKDLAIVCSNCHRMLHRCRPSKTIEQLRELIAMRNGARQHSSLQ